MLKLLLIEDDTYIAEELRHWLEHEFHSVDHVVNGEDGLYRLTNYFYDLAIIDWNLPDIEGVEICTRIRQFKHFLPLLMLTSRGNIKDKIAGLDAGALDYLVKPPSLPELSARIRSLLRRANGLEPAKIFRLANVAINEQSREFFIDKNLVKLPPIQFDLLVLLVSSLSKPLSKESIVKALWQGSDVDAGSNFKTQLFNLQKKFIESKALISIDFDPTEGYKLTVAPTAKDSANNQ